jgi:opacity protein-like surface antigen
MKNIIRIGFFIFILTVSEAYAQISFVNNVSNKGTVAAAFLEIGVNARAEGMGGAYTAMKGEADMIYWNPAGLAFVDGVTGSFSNTQWLASTTFNFAAFSVPLPVIKSVVSASFTTLGVPEQEVRDFGGLRTGELWDARDFAVNISIASRLTNNFSFGLTGKYINQRIWSETATGAAFDFGVTFITPINGLTMGSSISNFGGDMSIDGKNLFDTIDPDPANEGVTNIPVKLETDEFPLPQIFRFGLSYEYEKEFFSSVASVDLMHPTGSTENMNLGLEMGFRQIIFVRVGYQNLFERDQINGLTLGTGIQYKLNHMQKIGFDYAYSDWGILGGAHRISMSIYL